MKNQLTPSLTFCAGVAAALGLVMLLGAADQPAAKPRQLDTQLVPLAGGLALVLSINDRDNNRLYVYKFPSKKDDTLRLSGSIDLSATGKDELPSELKLD